MADVFILDRNRQGLKAVFRQHCDSEGRLSYSEALKFAQSLRIYPVLLIQDLLNSLELKRLFFKAADRFTVEEHRVELSYLQFERLLKLISAHCFSDDLPSAQQVQLLLAHIHTPCLLQYKVTLVSEQLRRGDSFDSAEATRAVLRKNMSLAGLTPSHRKSLGKPSVSLTRILVKSGTTDSLATERPSKAQALKQKVQQLYQIISPKEIKQQVRGKLSGTLTVKGRKLDLAADPSPLTSVRSRITSVPQSTRQLSETLSHYLSFDRKQSETSIKLASQDSGLIVKIKRAVRNLEAKTDLALQRTKLQGRRKRALSELVGMFQDSQEKVRSRQRMRMQVCFLRWKVRSRAY